MKTALTLLLIVTAILACYEIGERRFYTEVAGCPCESCIEAYEDQQREINRAIADYERGNNHVYTGTVGSVGVLR